MSTAAIPVHVALVDATGTIDDDELAQVAGALNEQVQADFAPVWRVAATVGAYPRASVGTWRIELRDGLDQPGAAGYHADAHKQPYALVDAQAGDWHQTASHELLEMLADPWGARFHTAAAPKGWSGASRRVRYLLEVCDPPEVVGYEVGGVQMSDFILPAFYRSARRGALAAYSHTGAIREPLQVIDGGYVSFVDPATDEWWQRFVSGDRVQDVNQGRADLGAMTPREWVDAKAREVRAGSAGA
ncbi:MAG TPA: hypothetical protein VFV85_10125 [Conexibacter sp.]|nr:hypothetical protein [Conexibacter sp.]